MIDDLNLDELRRIPRVSYYFRYPLHRQDFHELKLQNNDVRGHYAAKPLYSGLKPDRRVDRSTGYSGDIAALFVPLEAQTVKETSIMLSHLARQRIMLPNGHRNWPAIRETAENSIRKALLGPPYSV
jgi:hypothetical protein